MLKDHPTNLGRFHYALIEQLSATAKKRSWNINWKAVKQNRRKAVFYVAAMLLQRLQRLQRTHKKGVNYTDKLPLRYFSNSAFNLAV